MKSLARVIFRLIAAALLKKYHPLVIVVAGSVGKTGTKEAIAAALASPHRRVRKTEGSFNAEVGVPVTILSGGRARTSFGGWLIVLWMGLRQALFRRPYPDALVLEIGTDKPGDLRPLMTLVQPTIGVVTALTPEHMEFFDTLEAVVAEESLAVRLLPSNGTAILNADDPHSQRLHHKVKGRVMTFGWAAEADIRIDQVRILTNDRGLPTGQIVKLAVDGSVIPVALPGVIGRHQAYPIAAAVAVGRSCGDELFDIVQRLSTYRVPAGRMRVFAGVEGTVLIDDSYNASPEAMRAAIETLSDLEVPGKKHFILGQMSELGASSTEWHDQIGQAINPEKISTIVTVGPLAKRIGDAVALKRLSTVQIINVPTAEAAATALRPRLGPGDAVLIKGSHYPKPGYGGWLNRAVKILLADPARDSQELVGAEK